MADWLDACRWIKEHLPQSSVVMTPTQESWAFKWFAEAAEFVNYKDCPQDGPGIVEWNDRLLFLRDWSTDNIERGYSVEVTAPLYMQHGITHILTKGIGPFSFVPLYRNSTYRLYRIDNLPDGRKTGP